MFFRYLIILFFLIPLNSFALIEVDITRGNLSPLPIVVSPLSLDKESKQNLQKGEITKNLSDSNENQ